MMLVLTRQAMEEIKIGEEITLKVLKITRRRVYLGLEAPKEVRILRGEVMAKWFPEWLKEFKELLVQSGIPERQAERYEQEFRRDAFRYYIKRVSPGDAVAKELLVER